MKISSLQKMNALSQLKGKRRLVALTAYDYPTARLADEVGIDMLLVGDSLGMVALGLKDTTQVTLDMMIHHVKAVARGVQRSCIVGDLPFKTYETAEQTLASARLLIAAGADGVKLEGGRGQEENIKALVDEGIPVVGHLGVLPQSIHEEGGYRKKGKKEEEYDRIYQEALLLEKLGVIAIVLECVVNQLARAITQALSIPTIGIGSHTKGDGPTCDGEIAVIADVVGSYPWFVPPFAPLKGDVASVMRDAIASYVEEVIEFLPTP